MALSLKKLSIICKKYGMENLAGSDGLNKNVRWIHTVEDKDILEFLRGGELVFTTGIVLKNNGYFDFVHTASALIDKKAAGWVINIGPYIKKIPDELIDFCNKNKFPLFTLPWKEKLVDITYDLTHIIMKNDEKVSSLSKNFSNVIYRNGDLSRSIEDLEREGFMSNAIYKVLYIDPLLDKGLQTDYKLKINSCLKHFILADGDKAIVVVSSFNTYDIDDIISQISSYYDDLGIKFRIGLSNEQKGIDCLDRLYKQAKIACEYSHDYDMHITEYKDTGLYQVICNIEDENILSNYSNLLLKDIKDYDAKNGTNYLEIIELYILKDGSVNDVAQELNVHRNTINYRLKFIKDYFNINMSIESLSRIYLAIIIDKVKGR